MLIPYMRYDIAFAFLVARLHAAEKLSVKQLADNIANRITKRYVSLEYQQIKLFLRIIDQAYYKLASFPITAEQLRQSSELTPALKLISFVENNFLPSPTNMIKAFTPVSPAGLPARELLALLTYHQYQQNPFMERVFCFGTPSHKRRQAEPHSPFT